MINDYKDTVAALQDAQGAEEDLREQAREAHLFVEKRDGQWEPTVWQSFDNRPRYTFDMTSPIVDQIARAMAVREFDIKIRPADGMTSDEDAKLYDAMVRTIQARSGAKHVYANAARGCVIAGIDGWRVTHDYEDSDCFYETLRIEPIFNFVDSVWFDTNAKRQDMSDARWGFLLEAMAKKDYDERFPEGSGHSVSQDRWANAYWDKADMIIVGQMYEVIERPRTLILLTNGTIVEDTKQYRRAKDELAKVGITEVERRSRPERMVKTRLFDGMDWLTDSEDTVFSYVPLIPIYANHRILEDKVVYRGAVERLMDPQRVFNYAKSREIEEGALAPRAKYWATLKQTEGHERTLRTLNTNADPVQHYNVDPEAATNPPQQQGGAVINPGLQNVGESMRNLMGQVAGMFAASQGDNPGLQSGVAIEKLQERGDAGTYMYFGAMEVALAHTGRVLVDAIPKVFSEEQQMQLVGKDQTIQPVILNQQVFDVQTQQFVTVNNVAKGKYNVICTSGPSFESRQAETVQAITEIATIDPTVIETGADILFDNMSAPGMNLLAERKRLQLFNAGLIPDSQLTPEEMQLKQQAAQNPPPPDPATILAEAEAKKAEAQTAKVQIDAQLSQQKEQREAAVAQARLQLEQMQMALQQQNAQFDQVLRAQEQQRKDNETLAGIIEMQTKALNSLREAIGADAIINPVALEAYQRQAETVIEAQNEAESPEQSGTLEQD